MNTERKELPDGWKWVKLGDVCRVFSGSPAPQGQQFFNSDGPRFFRVSDLSQHGRTISLSESRDRLSQDALTSRKLVSANKGTVIFPKSGAAIATNNRALLAVDGYIVSHLMGLEPKDEVLSEYLYYVACDMDMMDYANNTGYPSLKLSVMRSTEIPLPPLPEQNRIIATLSEQMSAIEKARRAAEDVLEAVEALRGAILRELLP